MQALARYSWKNEPINYEQVYPAGCKAYKNKPQHQRIRFYPITCEHTKKYSRVTNTPKNIQTYQNNTEFVVRFHTCLQYCDLFKPYRQTLEKSKN